MQEFDLLPDKEAAPLQDFIDEMVAKEDARSGKRGGAGAGAATGGGERSGDSSSAAAPTET